MEPLVLPVQFILSFLLGAVFGLEREVNEKKGSPNREKPVAILGVRSFSLVSVLGTIVGLLYKDFMMLSLLIGGTFCLLLIVFYYLDSVETQNIGITTELALLYSFLTGILISLDLMPIQLTLAISVIVMLLLSQKQRIKTAVEGIQTQEINAFVSFAIIALVILPFLPNQNFAIKDIPFAKNLIDNFGLDYIRIASIQILNPFKLWLIVALITGVNLAGYILERAVGHKQGWILASIAGGFISSTATTESLAHKSKTSSKAHTLLAAALIANLVSFIQIAILIGSVNIMFLSRLLPTLAIVIGTVLILVFYFLYAEDKTKQTDISNADEKQKQEIFNLIPALRFAFMYLVIGLISKFALILFGQAGFLATTGLGAFIGLDAVMINTAQLAGETIDYIVAIYAFIIANAVNLLAKCFYSYLQGSKAFAVKLSLSMALIIVSSLVGLFFV
ncbi:MAG: hypothetical protein RI947_902 [Candidatus Parcubacteria bacterium]|jgi:uncharacterized membrane protein (DUF4010 family)